MIECVVIPRDEAKIADFIGYMEKVLGEEQVVAGTHGHAGDCNFHIYLLLNLSQQQDREKLIHVMTKITEKVCAIGGSMSAEHADGRTRGVILPHVFGLELFDLFVQIKELMDPRHILHPGVKIIEDARNKKLDQAIEELVGIEEKDSRLNLARFRDFSHLYSGACSFCSQCADICPVFDKLSEEFTSRSQAAPAFKRALAMSLDINKNFETLKDDPLFQKIFDLCLLCGQCTFKCATNASMRDIVIKVREARRSKVIAPVIDYLMAHPGMYNFVIHLLGATQGLWSNKVSRKILSAFPQGLLPTRIPYQRYLPKLSRTSVKDRYPELVDIPASRADIALFLRLQLGSLRGAPCGQLYPDREKKPLEGLSAVPALLRRALQRRREPGGGPSTCPIQHRPARGLQICHCLLSLLSLRHQGVRQRFCPDERQGLRGKGQCPHQETLRARSVHDGSHRGGSCGKT